MWSLPHLLKPRDIDNSIVPAVCYHQCDNAYLEGQSRGRVASLCDPDSAFNNYYQGCRLCVQQSGGNSTALVSLFSSFLTFCEDTAGASVPIDDLSWLAPYLTVISTAVPTSNLVGEPQTDTFFYRQETITTFSTRQEYFFHLSVGSIVSSYIPPSIFSQLALSVSLSAAAASVTGDATSLIYAALESPSAPSWFSAAVPSSYSSQMYTLQEQINELRATPVSLAPLSTFSSTSSDLPSQTSPSSEPGAQRSKAWIAGTIVGGIAAACLFALGIFVLQQRRRRREAERAKLEGDMAQETGDKPQLHSDHLPPRRLYEMDASHNPSEADDGALPEMAANEAPAQEMAADHPHSRALGKDKDGSHTATSVDGNV